MKPETLQKVMSKISAAAQSGNLTEVQRLTPIAARLQQLIDQRQSLDQEEEELLESIKANGPRLHVASSAAEPQFGNNNHRITRHATRGGLCVEMNLPRAGKIKLEERTAAETMIVVMERVLAEFGIEALERLQSLRTGRGPLLSKKPQTDFLNPKKGELYAHRRVPGTDLYVLTHSATPEKIEDLQRAFRLIGLPPTSFRVFRSNQ